jgi:4-amino-4-deoxychorismate lyase
VTGLIETILIREHVAVFLENHLERLMKGAKTLGISIADDFSMDEALPEHGVLKLHVDGKGLQSTISEPRYSEEALKLGWRAAIGQTILDGDRKLRGIKHDQRNLYRQARNEYPELDETIMLNPDGFICEGTRTNLFFIKQGIVHTAEYSPGMLEGITRMNILELCKSNAIQVKIGRYHPDDLLEADEVFFCNSLIGIVHLQSLGFAGESVFFPLGVQTKNIQSAYDAGVENYLSERR